MRGRRSGAALNRLVPRADTPKWRSQNRRSICKFDVRRRNCSIKELNMLICQDLRISWRMLRKSPGFAVVAVLCLAVGVGANSTVFSLVDGMWTRPLPVAK